MTRPNYCPNCAAKLDHLEMGESFMYLDNDDGGTLYDTFCHVCLWTGDIDPDDEYSLQGT